MFGLLRELPKAKGRFRAATQGESAVRCEGKAPDPGGVSPEAVQLPPALDVPDADHPIHRLVLAAARKDMPATGRVGHANDGVGMALEAAQFAARVHVPQTDRAIIAARECQATIGRK